MSTRNRQVTWVIDPLYCHSLQTSGLLPLDRFLQDWTPQTSLRKVEGTPDFPNAWTCGQDPWQARRPGETRGRWDLDWGRRTSGQKLQQMEESPRCPGLCSCFCLCMPRLCDVKEELGKKNQTTEVGVNVTNFPALFRLSFSRFAIEVLSNYFCVKISRRCLWPCRNLSPCQPCRKHHLWPRIKVELTLALLGFSRGT